METAQIPRHPDDIDLTWEQAGDALRALEGSHVAVRVVGRSDPEVLFAAFTGTLGVLDRRKDPAWFWPVCLAGQHEPAAAQDTTVHFERDRDHLEDMASTCVAIASTGPWDALDAPCWRSSKGPC